MPRTKIKTTDSSALQTEHEQLKRQLQMAQLTIEGYQIMGDILEEEYGIDLLKKVEAGQFLFSKKGTQRSACKPSACLFGYTRQAYYISLKRHDEGVMDDHRLLLHVGEIRKMMLRLRTRKLHYMLQEQGISVSCDRLFALLREHRMLVRQRKKYTVTTHSKHWMKKYPNLIRSFKFDKPNQF